VDQAHPVDGLQSLGETRRQGKHGLDGQWAVVLDRVGERWPWHVDGGHPGKLSLGVGVDNRGGVDAADVPRCGDLAGEPVAEPALFGQLGPDQLDRDKPPAWRLRQVNLAHTAGAQPPE
jgi:hypothetical protein